MIRAFCIWLFLNSWVLLLSTCSHTFPNLSCRIPSDRVLLRTSSLPEPNQLNEMAGVVLYWISQILLHLPPLLLAMYQDSTD